MKLKDFYKNKIVGNRSKIIGLGIAVVQGLIYFNVIPEPVGNFITGLLGGGGVYTVVKHIDNK